MRYKKKYVRQEEINRNYIGKGNEGEAKGKTENERERKQKWGRMRERGKREE